MSTMRARVRCSTWTRWAVVALGDAIGASLVLPFAVLGRVCLGRHWVVEVRAGFQPVWETDAGGWGESRAAIEELGVALGRGDYPWHPFPAGARRGQVLEEWVLRYATSDDATFDRPRRLRLGRPGVGAAGDR